MTGNRKYITYNEYEDRYHDALLVLKQRYESIGKPFQLNGERVCSVKTRIVDEPVILHDENVFLLAFGSELAHEIEQRVSESAISPW